MLCLTAHRLLAGPIAYFPFAPSLLVGARWQRYELDGGWQAARSGSVMLDGPTAVVRL